MRHSADHGLVACGFCFAARRRWHWPDGPDELPACAHAAARGIAQAACDALLLAWLNSDNLRRTTKGD